MRIKNVVYLFGLLLLLSGFMYRAEASSINSASFHGVGVTIDLTFPEEAHPGESITHNITITANTALTLRNFTVVIKAPVNSNWQEVFTGRDERNIYMPENSSFPWSMGPFPLPQGANGTLYCFMYVNTSQSADYSSFTFYTTQVRNMTYSELWNNYTALRENYSALNSLYTELSENYSTLQTWHNNNLTEYYTLLTKYETLLGDYNRTWLEYETLNATYNGLSLEHANLTATYNLLSANYDNLSSSFNALVAKNNALQSDYNSLNSTYYSLLANYSSLEGNYNSLLAKNNALQLDYNSLDSTHNNLQTIYNSLLGTKNTLQSDYNSLNSTHYSVQASYDMLRGAYDTLNRTYTSLVTEINDLNQRIHNSENALNTDRILMFIFTMTVAALIALIIYIKRKKPEPYVVIRKETVSLKPDETS